MVIQSTSQTAGDTQPMSQCAVTIVDCDHPSVDIEQAVLKDICPNVPWLHCKTEDEVIANCTDSDGLIIMYAPMTLRVLEKLPKCWPAQRWNASPPRARALGHGAVFKKTVFGIPSYT